MNRGVAGGAAADAKAATTSPSTAERAKRRRMAVGRSVGDGVGHAQLAAAGETERVLEVEFIEEVLSVERDVVGKFTPKIVKLDGAKHRRWGKKGREDEVAGE